MEITSWAPDAISMDPPPQTSWLNINGPDGPAKSCITNCGWLKPYINNGMFTSHRFQLVIWISLAKNHRMLRCFNHALTCIIWHMSLNDLEWFILLASIQQWFNDYNPIHM